MSGLPIYPDSPERRWPLGLGLGCLCLCAAASFVRREFKRHLFAVGSLDKQMKNEKEPIRLASAGVRGLFFICVENVLT